MDGLSQENAQLLGRFSCTTFNILAPIYKRLTGKKCENEFPELWVSRNESILDKLLDFKSSIICLQEFWVGNDELVDMYEKRLGEAGYKMYSIARTNNRGDGDSVKDLISALTVIDLLHCDRKGPFVIIQGLLAAVHQSCFRVLNYKECVFNGIGDRVAQLLDVELLIPPEDQFSKLGMRTLIVNTHLIFPHDSTYCFVRLKQVYKILQFLESYCHEYKLPALPVILCGDWNGSMKGNVCSFLLSQGFVSAYDIAHGYVDHIVDHCEWVSHRNHRGNICAVDFVWLLNPNISRKPLKRSLMEALLRNFYKLQTEGVSPLRCPQIDPSSVTYAQFSEVLAKRELIGPPYNVFSAEEIKDLWGYIECNGDGMIDMTQFSMEFDPCTFGQVKGKNSPEAEIQTDGMDNTLSTMSKIGFIVDKAKLFPGEVERGIWPENYSLSDHAMLTIKFLVVPLTEILQVK